MATPHAKRVVGFRKEFLFAPRHLTPTLNAGAVRNRTESKVLLVRQRKSAMVGYLLVIVRCSDVVNVPA